VVLPGILNLNRAPLAPRNFEPRKRTPKKEQQYFSLNPNQIIQPGNISMEGPL
jgi:hypothetical protein